VICGKRERCGFRALAIFLLAISGECNEAQRYTIRPLPQALRELVRVHLRQPDVDERHVRSEQSDALERLLTAVDSPRFMFRHRRCLPSPPANFASPQGVGSESGAGMQAVVLCRLRRSVSWLCDAKHVHELSAEPSGDE
jgi:hypothetical protein